LITCTELSQQHISYQALTGTACRSWTVSACCISGCRSMSLRHGHRSDSRRLVGTPSTRPCIFTAHTHTQTWSSRLWRSKLGIAVRILPLVSNPAFRYETSHAIWDHTVTFPPLPKPKLVLDLATPNGCNGSTDLDEIWHGDANRVC